MIVRCMHRGDDGWYVCSLDENTLFINDSRVRSRNYRLMVNSLWHIIYRAENIGWDGKAIIRRNDARETQNPEA